MKNVIKLVLLLAIVSGLSGLCVGYVNSVTEPIINENLIAAEKGNLELMFPGENFKSLEIKDESGYILGAYEVEGIGTAVKFTCVGYNGSSPVVGLVGFDKDHKVVDVIALSQQETKGFGARVFEEDNIKNLYVSKNADQEFDLLSGATVTSTAMKNCLTAIRTTLVEGGY